MKGQKPPKYDKNTSVVRNWFNNAAIISDVGMEHITNIQVNSLYFNVNSH